MWHRLTNSALTVKDDVNSVHTETCGKIIPSVPKVPTSGYFFLDVAFLRAKSFHHIHVQLVQSLTQGLSRNIHVTKNAVFNAILKTSNINL